LNYGSPKQLSYQQHPEIGNGKVLNCKKLLEPFLVEPDGKFIADDDDRHTHLTAFFYHFPALFKIGCDVEVGVLDLVGVKKFFRHVAEMTCRRRVNSYLLLCCHRFAIIS